ncbi:DUF1330 domain-containing protein [Rhodococcus sp. IEGM 1408]|uniref:DUF1330 domain-containing protein n=1 Tax=Rhodococcus sp. IEGM 1408 TaxID=3082220 RepID=UPI002953569C|nr:DUF1330 domain-containing protein [Rhodococcus sp. IEGM 1408]MDV8000735.1 DUF1330 domain-containing protein [Rhodococcus sp. IEGM 1408]
MAAPAYVLVRRRSAVRARIGLGHPFLAPSLGVHGAEVSVQNPPARVLEGAWDGFVTLLRFAELSAAERWYDSPEYTAARRLRQKSSTPKDIIVEGVAGTRLRIWRSSTI